MKDLTHKTQDTKAGTSNNLVNETLKENNSKHATRADINEFLDDVSTAIQAKVGDEMPCVEANKRIIEHYNRGSMQGFKDVGYFIFNGVKVFEKGKVDEFVNKDKLTMEQVVFRG